MTSFGMTRILVLAPHPDDEVFGCGGAILRQISEGGSVQVVVVTDGDHQPSLADVQKYAQTRREESHKAAQVLGYGTPIFWGLKDRCLEYGEKLVQRIQNHIAEYAPDGVFAPSIYEMHPDHRYLGMAALEAARRCGAPLQLVMYEVGIPIPRPNVLLDISALAERKQRAMTCFVSQLQGQAYDQQIRALNCFRTYTLGPYVTAAEAYSVVQSHELARGILEFYESEHQRQLRLGLPMFPEDVPLVSVIAYSPQGQFPQSVVDSIALQTYSHLEVVLVCEGGGITNSMSAVRDRFPVREVQVASTKEQAKLWNVGMGHAQGKYIILLEPGGVFFPDHLQKLVTSLATSDALATCTGVQFMDQQGQPIAVLDEQWNAEQLQNECFLPSNAVLFDRTLIEQGCRFNEALGQLAFRDFCLQIAALTEFRYTSGLSAAYRITVTALGRLAVNQRLQIALADTEEQIAALQARLSQLHASVEIQTARATSIENTVYALHSSTSWRVTRPIRFLSRFLRGRL